MEIMIKRKVFPIITKWKKEKRKKGLKQNYPQGKANLGIEIHGISNEGWFWRKGWHKLKYWTKRINEA